jgi:glutathione synthase/RimK-type ligase-like ATP-grasp enzyme
MTRNHIVILTDYKDSFRQLLRDYESMNIETIEGYLKREGFNVEVVRIASIINDRLSNTLKNSFIVYTSSQESDYKLYLDDVFYELSQQTILIPSYDIFRAHENKGYQHVLQERLEINSLSWNYFGCLEDSYFYLDRVTYPIILKNVGGYGSKNVHKIENKEHAISMIKKLYKCKMKLMKKHAKKYVFRSKYSIDLESESFHIGRFIFQEFIPELEYDWKIMVFGNKYYVLKRKVRKGDFRASGSGRFEFVVPSDLVLNFAREVFKKLDVPFVSLDILEQNGKCFLTEFQGLHFGPYTLMFSPFYFKNENNSWHKIDKSSILEVEFSNAIVQYIKNKYY